MSPRSRRRSTTRRIVPPGLDRLVVIVVAAALGLALAGCAPAFDPTGPCTTDGSVKGAYPELEASVPTAFRGGPPSDLDSGRACTPSGLGTLASHGVTEIRFAGATWEIGSDSGVSLAVFSNPTGPALEPGWVADFYETGARGGKNVTSVETTDYAVTGAIGGRRVDVLNGESYQSIVIWEWNGQIAVALVANAIRSIQTRAAHDEVVRAAVDAFGT